MLDHFGASLMTVKTQEGRKRESQYQQTQHVSMAVIRCNKPSECPHFSNSITATTTTVITTTTTTANCAIGNYRLTANRLSQMLCSAVTNKSHTETENGTKFNHTDRKREWIEITADYPKCCSIAGPFGRAFAKLPLSVWQTDRSEADRQMAWLGKQGGRQKTEWLSDRLFWHKKRGQLWPPLLLLLQLLLLQLRQANSFAWDCSTTNIDPTNCFPFLYPRSLPSAFSAPCSRVTHPKAINQIANRSAHIKRVSSARIYECLCVYTYRDSKWSN